MSATEWCSNYTSSSHFCLKHFFLCTWLVWVPAIFCQASEHSAPKICHTEENNDTFFHILVDFLHSYLLFPKAKKDVSWDFNFWVEDHCAEGSNYHLCLEPTHGNAGHSYECLVKVWEQKCLRILAPAPFLVNYVSVPLYECMSI